MREARSRPSTCDVEPSCLRFQRMVLPARGPSPAPHELPVMMRQRGGSDAVRASSWLGRRGGEGVLGPLTELVRRGLLPVL